METRANYVQVGAFVLAVLAGLALFAIWMTRSGDKGTAYYTYFSGSVTGLNVGSPVRYRGVPVGSVDDIVIDPENIERIRVTMRIRPDAPIQVDAVASLESAGITGGSYVQIKGGRKGTPRLESKDGEIPVIPSEPGLLGSLADQAPQLLQNLVTLSERANEFLSPDNSKALAGILADLKTLTQQLSGAGPDLASAMKNLDRLSQDLRTEVPKLTQSLQSSLKEIDGMSADLHGLVRENRAPIRDFSNNGLVQLTAAIADLRRLIDSLSRVAERVDRDPREFLFGGTGRGVDPRQGVPTR
ncbi:MlaD family protein [Roseiterribacter gracilis]|uniref:ABC transporter permease n=1 Tax=Roseiterribacter gracilis TaxID=2812848 RepID=A0A8S8X9Q5_9PROT|nr:ABC transporter permease [Rhodospirillales bacterium TMPK1]